MKGTWQTTGDDDASKAVTAVVGLALVAALAYGALKGAARMLGEVAIVGIVAAVALVAGVGVALLAVRLRRRRSVRPPQPAVQLWHANPQAVPARQRDVLPAPVVNVNIDAGLLAGLISAARQQETPVIVTPAREEVEQ